MYCGMPFGAALASVIGIVSPGDASWRHIFYVGGIGPILTLPLLGLFLKESTHFIAASSREAGGVAQALWKKGRTSTTLALWTSYLGTLIVLYFLMNWLPSMVVSRGLTRVQASVVQMMFNIGGGIGAIVIAGLMDRIGKRPVVVGMYVGIAAALLALAGATGSVTMACGGLLAGLFLVGGQSVLYALAGAAYPTQVRGTGVGAAVAVGRVGSMVGPLIAGQLLALGQSASMLVLSSIPPIVIAAIGALTVTANLTRETHDAADASPALRTESI
jgi:MFS transporter, AAHS family, 3-hydroxyphenylpropionic acid transporter